MRIELPAAAELNRWAAVRGAVERGLAKFTAERCRAFLEWNPPDGTVLRPAIPSPAALWDQLNQRLLCLAGLEADGEAAAELADGGTRSLGAMIHLALACAEGDPDPELRAALGFDPGFAEARLRLALVWLERGDLAAAADLARGLEVGRSRCLREFAAALWQHGLVEEAAEFVERALAVEPASAAAQAMRGALALETGAIEDARAWARRAAAHDSAGAGPWRLLGEIERAAGHPDEAAAALEEALRREPGDAGLLVTLAETRLEQDDVPGARDLLERAAPALSIAAVWGNLAYLRRRLGDAAGAREALARALALDPGQPALRELAEWVEDPRARPCIG